jgi:hypothetical protein
MATSGDLPAALRQRATRVSFRPGEAVFRAGSPSHSIFFVESAAVRPMRHGRPNLGQDCVYFRAQMKDALGIAHFAPALTAIMNWQGRSCQLGPEMQYIGP